MSNLVVIAYHDHETAEHVRRTLLEMRKEHIIELEDLAVVSRAPDGKVKLRQATSLAAGGEAGGALWGGLIGLLFLAPLLGVALGVEDEFVRELGTSLHEGGAAVIVLVRRSTPDKVLPRIREYGGHVLQKPLSTAAEADLAAARGESASV